MYFVKTPRVIQNLFPNYTWKIPVQDQRVYLTFDDGPSPEVTPWVLNQLAAYDAKATFFAVGENVEQHPDLFQQVIDAGHTVGNHTYSHLSGCATENISFFHDARRGAQLVNSTLFRPPYGRVKPRQAQFLQRHYRIIMWDILSGDFDNSITKEQCLYNVLHNVEPGSIIVFHDNNKAKDKLAYVLPRVLEHLQNEGYQFDALNNEVQQTENRALKIA